MFYLKMVGLLELLLMGLFYRNLILLLDLLIVKLRLILVVDHFLMIPNKETLVLLLTQLGMELVLV